MIRGTALKYPDDDVIASAQKSPVYKFVKEWGIALPPHIEYRTLPMLFYVPPMSPVMHRDEGSTVTRVSDDFFHDIDQSRVPMQFLANLFGAGQCRNAFLVLKPSPRLCDTDKYFRGPGVQQRRCQRLPGFASSVGYQHPAVLWATGQCSQLLVVCHVRRLRFGQGK